MPDPAPRNVGDELVRAADRDLDQLRYIEQLYGRLVQLSERVGDLEQQLAAERTARERLELRLYAHELRDADAPLVTDAGDDTAAGELVELHSRRCAERITEYAPDTEPYPTTEGTDPA